MKWVMLILGIILILVTIGKPRTEEEAKKLNFYFKHKWKFRIAGIFFILISLILFTEPKSQKEGYKENTKEEAEILITKEKAQKIARWLEQNGFTLRDEKDKESDYLKTYVVHIFQNEKHVGFVSYEHGKKDGLDNLRYVIDCVKLDSPIDCTNPKDLQPFVQALFVGLNLVNKGYKEKPEEFANFLAKEYKQCISEASKIFCKLEYLPLGVIEKNSNKGKYLINITFNKDCDTFDLKTQKGKCVVPTYLDIFVMDPEQLKKLGL